LLRISGQYSKELSKVTKLRNLTLYDTIEFQDYFKQLRKLTVNNANITPVRQVSLPLLQKLCLIQTSISFKSLETILQGVASTLVYLKIIGIEVASSTKLNVSFKALENFILDSNVDYGLIDSIRGSTKTLNVLQLLLEKQQSIDISDFKNLKYLCFKNSLENVIFAI
jgi:hypothetical protein